MNKTGLKKLKKDYDEQVKKKFWAGDDKREQNFTLPYRPKRDYLCAWNFGYVKGDYSTTSHSDMIIPSSDLSRTTSK